MFTDPIALLPPGDTLTVFYDNAMDRKDRDDLPDLHTATVSYTGDDGDDGDKAWTDTYKLDLGDLSGTRQINVYGQHHAVQELKKIVAQLKPLDALARPLETIIETVRHTRNARRPKNRTTERLTIEPCNSSFPPNRQTRNPKRRT